MKTKTPPEPLTETSKGYSIIVTRDDGSRFYASGRAAGRFFDPRRQQAIAFKDDLLNNGIKKAKVVKVQLTIETLP